MLDVPSGLELAPAPAFAPAPEPVLASASSFATASFDPAAPFAPAAVGMAGEVVPALENPYQAPRARVDRPLVRRYDPLAGMVLASRLRRLAAVIVNTLIFLVPIVLVAAISGDLADFAAADADPNEIVWIVLRRMFIFFVPIVLVNVYLLAKSGQTLGKKALGVRIVRYDGSEASLARLLVLRFGLPNTIGMIPFLGSFFGLLDALFIFGDERRCIHDHFADTKVVLA
ncbi:MAG TPA: RDD family protein [Thermoanaerobaculia bacterium]